jgi:hypothetical protein
VKNETKIYIKDLKMDTTNEMLSAALEEFGEIVSCSVK